MNFNWETPYTEWKNEDQEQLQTWVKKLLTSDQEVVLEFYKADGTKRELRGTLNESVGAKYSMNENKENTKKPNLDVCVVYDLDKDAWRSFRWDRLTNVQYNLV